MCGYNMDRRQVHKDSCFEHGKSDVCFRVCENAVPRTSSGTRNSDFHGVFLCFRRVCTNFHVSSRKLVKVSFLDDNQTSFLDDNLVMTTEIAKPCVV